MVIGAPEHIATIAADIDVFQLRAERCRLKGQMGLQDPAVRLGVEHGDHRLQRHLETDINPRRNAVRRHTLFAASDQLVDHLLGKGGAGLGPGRYDHIIVAQSQVVPAL